MNMIIKFSVLVFMLFALQGCEYSSDHHGHNAHDHGTHDDHAHDETPKGIHGGRLLTDGNFAVEIAIFEAGMPPEYRAWVTSDGHGVKPNEVDLTIRLDRLGGKQDTINFIPQSDYLRGDQEIDEPHSFIVSINASYKGKNYQWQYESFEGRTTIDADMASSFDLATSKVGPAVLKETITVYGKIVENPAMTRNIHARFEGEIKKVFAEEGEVVKKGQNLAQVESNESLSSYTIKAPINGIITKRFVNPGEQTMDRTLFIIKNIQSVWANFKIFPNDRIYNLENAKVHIKSIHNNQIYTGKISNIGVTTDSNQAITARVVLNNTDNQLNPGMFVSGEIITSHYEVPLAVKRSGLQTYRDFDVVYAQFDNQYEVRMLQLGRKDNQWVEILGGIDKGISYVSKNSYLVKADIEKSAAAHDH